jgi:putative transposase
VHKVYRYRLYPTKAQETKMNQTLELCRFVYNKTLAIRKDSWEQEQKSISNYDTHNLLPSWKAVHQELKMVHSQVLQETQQRVDLAFKAFFRRVKAGEKEAGYPRFKGKGRYDSFTYPRWGF